VAKLPEGRLVVSDKRSTEFSTAFGRLIALYRSTPAAAKDAAPLLADAVRLVTMASLSIEAGIHRSGEYDTANLRSHLLRRQIELLTIAAGATADTLEALARALGGDGPLPDDPALGYEMVATLVPESVAHVMPSTKPTERAGLVLMGPADESVEDNELGSSGLGAEIAALTEAVAMARARGAWTEALHAAQALVRLASRAPELDRRTVSIMARRALSRPVLQGIIDFAVRAPEEQPRAAEVLQWRGVEAAELMVDVVRRTESPVPHRFLLDALARMPAAVPLLLPLLTSSHWHEVRHSAEVLGRLMQPEALPPLKTLLAHPDERVRAAALDALSRYPGAAAVEAMRSGLAHPNRSTRLEAARAIGRRGGGALAMPLLAALELEKDAPTWHAMLLALANIEAPEAAAALASVALTKRGLLSRGGFSPAQRLEVVAALAGAPTRAARTALARVAREADREVGAAARVALERAGTGAPGG
jgi:hypothetical protein